MSSYSFIPIISRSLFRQKLHLAAASLFPWRKEETMFMISLWFFNGTFINSKDCRPSIYSTPFTVPRILWTKFRDWNFSQERNQWWEKFELFLYSFLLIALFLKANISLHTNKRSCFLKMRRTDAVLHDAILVIVFTVTRRIGRTPSVNATFENFFSTEKLCCFLQKF